MSQSTTAHSAESIEVATAAAIAPALVLRSIGQWSSLTKKSYLSLKAEAFFNSQKLSVLCFLLAHS